MGATTKTQAFEHAKMLIQHMNGLSEEGFKNRYLCDPAFHAATDVLVDLYYNSLENFNKRAQNPYITHPMNMATIMPVGVHSCEHSVKVLEEYHSSFGIQPKHFKDSQEKPRV